MATKPNSNPPPAGEPDSDAYDPNRYTVTRMPTEFLRWMMKNPLPKAKKEDLWKDTLPPGMHPNAQLVPDDEGALAALRTDEARQSTPLAHAARVESGKSKRSVAQMLALLALCAAFIGGAVALFAGNDPPADEQAKAAIAAKKGSSQQEQRPVASASRPVAPPASAEAEPAQLTPPQGVKDKPAHKVSQKNRPSLSGTKPAPPPAQKTPTTEPAAKAAGAGDLELIVGQ